MSPKYIQILGYSGSGKSSLAATLAAHYNLPLLYLDTIHFVPGSDWVERPLDNESALVRKFLSQHAFSGWVIDGNYTRLCPERFEMADLSIYLDFGRFYCLWSCLKRWWEWRGRVRESNVCTERMDWDFFRWILWDGRTTEVRGKNEESFEKGRGEKLVFRNRKEVEEWVAGLRKEE